MPFPAPAKRAFGAFLCVVSLGTSCLPGPTALPPELAVSVETLSFSAAPGGAALTQTFTVANAGAGTMPWTVAGNSSWITVQPTSGNLTAGQSVTVTVTVSPISLAAGTHNGTVTVTGRDAEPPSRVVAVGLTVREPGRLALGATSLSFSAVQGSSPAAQTVTVTNSGGSSLSWTAAGNQSWLGVTPASGTLAAGQSATLSVSATSASLAAGAYTGAVTVTAPGATGSPAAVSVALTVTAPGSLTLGATSLSFSAVQGSSPATQTVTVTNRGGSNLSWTAAGNQSWLSVTPASGTLAINQVATLTVAVTSASLAAGAYTGTVTVTAPGATGSPASVAVALGVAAPAGLSVTPSSLSFSAAQGSSPAAQTLTVTNSGGSSLSWTAAGNQSWLGVTPASGTLAGGQSATLSVSATSASLAAGAYTGAVTVTAPGATGSPAAVSVALTVTAVATPATLIHRWTFSETGGSGTTLVDDRGGKHATIVEVGAQNATVSGGYVTLTGGARDASDFVQIPAGVLSPLANASIEVWATQWSAKNWGRIFDFGSGTNQSLLMSWSRGTDINADRAEWAVGASLAQLDNAMAPYTLGTEFQIVMTLQANGGPNGATRVRLYRNGVLRGTFDAPNKVSDLVDTHNHLGRSQWANDETANASYHELRIYNGVLTDSQVAERYALGPVADKFPGRLAVSDTILLLQAQTGKTATRTVRLSNTGAIPFTWTSAWSNTGLGAAATPSSGTIAAGAFTDVVLSAPITSTHGTFGGLNWTVTASAGTNGSPKTIRVDRQVLPSVTSRSPASGATKVRIEGQTITATFQEGMDASTLNTSTFKVTTGGAAVTGTVSYNASTRTVTFTPAALLREFGTQYTVTVTTGAKNADGGAFPADESWSFRTVMFDQDYYYHLVNDFQGVGLPMAMEAGNTGRCYHASPSTTGTRWILLDASAYFGEGYFHVFNERFGYTRVLTGGDGSTACSTIPTPNNPRDVPAAANWFPLYIPDYDRHRLHTQGGGIGPATAAGDAAKLTLDDNHDGQQWRPWMRPSAAQSGQFWRFFNAGKIPPGSSPAGGVPW